MIHRYTSIIQNDIYEKIKCNLATLLLSLPPLVVPMDGRIGYNCALFVFTIQVESTSVALS